MTITDYYVTTDAMGSVMSVLDETGNVLERRSYDAFGEATYMLADGTVVPNSPTGVDIGFQGQLMDELTGMYQMGYRWYSPVLGRWVSRDPIGLEGGVNAAVFALNVPVADADPIGLVAVDIQLPSALIEPYVAERIDPLTRKETTKSGTRYSNFTFECECAPVDSKTWQLTCIVGFEAHITLSIQQAKDRNCTLAGIYGHEQRHIQSERFKWMRKLIKPLQEERVQFFSTKCDCDKRSRELRDKFAKEYDSLVFRASRAEFEDHKGGPDETPYSPIVWEPYSPLPGSPFPR